MFNTIALLQSSADSGLTLAQLVRDIPHDVPARVAYAMVIGFGYLIWRGSRPKKQV